MFNQVSIAGFGCKRFFACIMLMIGLASAPAFSVEQEIAWTEDYDAAVQRAASANCVLLLHFYGDYCPPCKLLDKKTFHDPSLVAAINENVVAVKINAEKRKDLATKYNVNRWPTDVYLNSNGDEIYRGVSDQDPTVYTKKIHRIVLHHRDWSLERESIAKNTQRGKVSALVADAPQTQPEKTGYANTTFQPTKSQSASSTNNSDPQRITQSALPQVAHAASLKQPRVIDNPYLAKQPLEVPAAPLHVLAETVGLGGYCPVTLVESVGRSSDAVWVRGSASFAVRHRGRIYHCSSEQARQTLLGEPDRYTPCLSGFDLVHFFKTGLLVDGKCEFGCIQTNSSKVYLFADFANYQEFERDNERFSRLLDRVTPERAEGRSSGTQYR
ncbi:MAG: thioredoxin family protein [Planctomycetota bacterium]|nr:thioredoxin family protein [Planctomycetota bacterium]